MRRTLMLLVLLAAAGGGAWVWWQRSSLPAATNGSETTAIVEIPSGTPAQRIGETLAERDLIRSPQAWWVWTLWQRRLRQRPGDFQAGTYAIDPTQTLTEIAEQIWTGDVQRREAVIPEGWQREDMAAYFEELGWFSAEEFLIATAQIPRDRFPWLPADLPHVEGFLFPDTYFFSVGMPPTAAQVRDRLLAQFAATALPVYEAARDRGEYDDSLLAWVTLASIVEKEAVVAAERDTIAGVFANRLQRGMRLAADPTVEYGLGIEQTPDRPLSLSDVRQPSPYNTYLNPGLPPTPIASPGLASLQATLAPMPTEYLFFVARYDGTHIFSRTFAEHTRAQQEIRRQRQQ